MFLLTAMTGAEKGRAWPVNDVAMTVGRDVTCDITVNDPTVSRRHCLACSSGDSVLVTDLDSSNATFVNAHPIDRARLQVGDELAVGGVLLVVSEAQAGAEPPRKPEDDVSQDTTMLKIGEPTFVEEGGEALFDQGRPRTAEDLAQLFNIGRGLSQASTRAGLITTLLQRLTERFDPEALWIVLFGSSGGETVYPPKEASAITANRDMRDILKRVRKKPRGVLFPERWTHDGQMGIRTTLVGPMALGKEPVGAIILQADTPHRIYDENDLEFLMAIAHAAAPYFRAVERLEQLERENRRLVSGSANAGPIIGSSRAIDQVRNLARHCAWSDLGVLVQGDTGTGKELAARMIHELSQRGSKAMVTVNCAAIPNELFESEVFGHEKGAYTGAHSAKTGLFEQANGGVLFLDEVGDLSLSNQARLLRAIETGTFRRLGGTKDVHVEVRIVAATNKDLALEVEAERFRRDLYHRVNTFEIRVPALRERRSDIPELAEHFLQQAQERLRASATAMDVDIEGYEAGALKALQERDWPGNVRELRNVIERAVVVARNRRIRAEDFATTSPRNGNEDHGGAFPTLQDLEKQHITLAIDRASGNIKAAADLLQIGRSTLYRKIADYDIPTQ